MCKAGFAGDDAPRAVFRKFKHPNVINKNLQQLISMQHRSSADHAIMGTLPFTSERAYHMPNKSTAS